ncbi:hypothetical protein B0H11DRAFT_2287954 [Mycena galericulata]|nr:hypothetical protein B0H11DRAFT_2287954 [Mycena galericulata]
MSSPEEFMEMATAIFLTHRGGDRLFDAGEFAAAQATYYEEARKLVGPECPIPAFGCATVSTVYLSLHPFKRTNLMGCCLGMARCLRRANQLELALAWLEEINSLHRVNYYESEHPLHDWRDWMLDIPDLSFLTSSGLCLASDIFASLGNSGTAAMRRWAAQVMTCSLGPRHLTPALMAVQDMRLTIKLLELRHPDPKASQNVSVSVPALQVRGSWTRLHVKPGGVTEGREDCSTFIWNSHFYVAGGRLSSKGPYYRDLWVLDLAKLDAWRQLPDYPVPVEKTCLFLGWRIVVHENIAIFFNGRPSVEFFDLKAEKWGSFETTYTPTAADVEAGVLRGWPYPVWTCQDAALQIVDGTLYVFGGGHGETRMGCNLFMALDLSTHQWRRLSGTVRVTEHGDYTCPGPRKNAASWVSPDRARIYILFGNCDRDAAYYHNDLHGSDAAFMQTDLWSWSVKQGVWRQERIAGNPPCARTEMAHAYNEKLQKAVVFGGYHAGLPAHMTKDGQQGSFPYTYFADTFIYDMPSSPSTSTSTALVSSIASPAAATPSWRQVCTPGFPTYRCQAHLQCDAATGRTYLFGGWTNSQFIPTRTKLLARSFGDLWELRMDVPGGYFEEVDFAEEMRVARAGPWQRCFACAAAGPWKKCGGTCEGRVFFCGTPCLREGWKEHKQLHGCRKA